MGTIYEKTDNCRLDLYGNNDPADLKANRGTVETQ